ncbi:MAG: 16S rRNA (cytosine(967)-C(5))-methyltransferase RsmB [Verrucomicrobiae bacterium]|nr:16S rRNA (cytosine(967)-C(5))-methyltransferase RsmB [Verrucomicrobiae bacterium]
MSNLNPRQIALEALITWDNGSKHADDILGALSQRHRLQGADHGLVQTLFYGVLRHITRLDAFIDELKRGRMNHENRCVLRIGIFQLFHTDIPPHAAVNETVSLARGMRGVINGILRNAQRKQKELEALAKTWPLAVSQSHPEFLIDRWIATHGEDATRKLCEWNNEPPPVYVRTNRLAPDGADSEAIVTEATHLAAKVKGKGGFHRLTSGAPPKEWLDAGLIYVQDPSTSVACDLLEPHRQERILDACAAPGGKAALLYDRMKGTGNILATDVSPDRLETVRQNLKRLGLWDRGIETAIMDWQRPAKNKVAQMPKFDGILVDVPCSNTGVIRRRVDVRWRLRPDEFLEMQRVQLAITESCLPVLKPGGRIVYSTCSLEPEENRGVVDLLLERHPDKLELEEIAESLPWRDGFDGAFAARLRLKK